MKTMIALTPENAAHRNCDSINDPDASRLKTEVFDDEGEELLTLYASDGTLRWPIKCILSSVWPAAVTLLEPWCLFADFIDSRMDKTNPLPRYYE
jgi:hypothetical protein